MTRRDKWAKRDCVQRYRAFKDKCRVRRVKVPERCHVTFIIAMPRSWSGSKRAALAGRPHMQKPDLDNLIKALLDAVHSDDASVWSVSAEKRWGDKGAIEVSEP